MRRVLFTIAPEIREPEAVARSSFEPDQSRIYAVCPTADYEQGAVMMKGHRSDPPQILLFERYPIHPGDGHGFVWLQPQGISPRLEGASARRREWPEARLPGCDLRRTAPIVGSFPPAQQELLDISV